MPVMNLQLPAMQHLTIPLNCCNGGESLIKRVKYGQYKNRTRSPAPWLERVIT